MAEKTKCPECKGLSSIIRPVFVDYSDGTGNIRHISKCSTCGGVGSVLTDVLTWLKRGPELRKARIDAGLTLRQASQLLGMRAAELSQFEQGRTDNTNFDPAIYARLVDTDV